MGRLTEYVIALVDYVNAEAQAARRGLVNVAIAVALALAAVCFAVAAIVLLHIALYLLLQSHPSVTRSGATALVAVVALISSGGLLWLARRTIT